MADQKSGRVDGAAAIVIVALGIAAIVWLTTIVIDRYETAGDAVSVLSVVVGPLAGIAAAAFGVKLSIDAKKETKEVKDQAGSIADDIRSLVTDVGDQRSLADAGAPTTVSLTQLEERLRRLSK